MPKKILCIEDSAEYSEMVVKALENTDPKYECTLADSLPEIERLLKEGTFDLVLSDFNLKGFDARDVLKARNALAPEIPLVLLTGSLSDEIAVDLLKLGAADYILKDRVARLPAAIKAAISEYEKKRALNAARLGLEESEARYRELFAASSDLIFLVSLEGTITECNPAFQAATGYSPGKTPPLRAEQLPAGTSRADFMLALEQAAKGQQAAVMETVFSSARGSQLTVEGAFHPRRKDGKVIYLQGIFHDITGTRSLEAQFRQSQKMEAVGRLAGGIAHDFNNILGAIEGYASLILNTLKAGDPIKPDIEEIRRAVARAAALTKQLLTFSRKQTLQKKPCRPNDVIESLHKMIARVIGEDVKLRLDLDPGLPGIMADPAQVDQLLMNLLLNSRDAMPDGGTVTVSTRLKEVAPDAVKSPNPAEAGGEFILISVNDTGQGMSRETLEHIFEPFFTTKPRGKGTGLGLAIVYGVVKQHNGWIDVESGEGRGSEFRVYLPARAGSPVPGPEGPAAAAAPRGGSSVLLVEDDDDLRNLAVKALREFGYRAESAGNAAEALAIFKARNGKFDIIFSDIVLSDRKATEIADDLARVNPEVRFIFTSGYLDDKTNLDFINSRGYKFIQKPYSIETLVKTIEETLKLI